jgi:Zn-dependent protease with chaperone function
MNSDFSSPFATPEAGGFAAHLLGPHLPSQGEAVQAAIINEQLCLPGHRIGLQQLQLHLSDDRQQAMLYWQDAQQYNWAVRIEGEMALAQLRAQAPAWLVGKLQRADAASSHHKLGWGLAALCGVGLLLVLGLVWGLLPWLAGWGAQAIPVAQEEKLGKLVLAQMRGTGQPRWLEHGPAQQAMTSIGTRLTPGSAYHYQWLIKHDASVNAFALPGGIVVVHTGLLKKLASADELAAVLSHEVQHVERRHSLKGILHQMGWSTLFGLLWGDVSGIAGALASQAGILQFSRELEAEADRLGYQALVRAGINPAGMVGVLQKFKQEAGVSAPGWLSSHPDTDARLAATRQALKDQPCPTCRALVLDWKAVQLDPLIN